MPAIRKPDPIPWVVVIEGEGQTKRILCSSQQGAERVADECRERFPEAWVSIEPGV